MKTLVIVGHNDLSKSKYSKAIVDELRHRKNQDLTVHILCEEYMHYNINVSAEKDLLQAYDRIVFVFPVQWYSVPSLLKKWQEDVLLDGFAYGKGGDKLKGKETYFIATSAGSAEDYSDKGYNNYPVMDYFKPFEQTFRLCSMDLRLPMFYQGVYREGRGSEESLRKLATEAYDYICAKEVLAWPLHRRNLKPKLV